MLIELRTVGDIVVVSVHGEISFDKGSDIALRDKMRSLIQQGHPKLVLDLGDVPYVDSAGLGEITRAYATTKRAGGDLKLLRVTEPLRRLLAVTKLARVFESYDSETAALTSFVPSV